VRAAAVHHFEPDAVLGDVNAVLWAEGGDEDDRYCTVVFARLELDTCGAWVTLASGGHPLPMLIRASGVIEERGRAGLPIGMFDSVAPVNDRIGLGAGDALIFFTDGITESRDASGDVYGNDRLRALLDGVAGRDAEVVADAVVRGARMFGTSLRDDVAVVVVRVPDDLGDDPLDRVAEATGVAAGDLRLPGYAHGQARPQE
jgi:serine phosphatase RsbU (regulator of sigma subunit)